MTDDEIERAMLGVWQDVPGAVNFGIAKPLTDRKLLELAARAAGIKYTIKDGVFVAHGNKNEPPIPWNPLDDDGDALRLAVRLLLDVMYEFDGDGNVVGVNANWDGAPAEVIQEIFDQDGVKATRRAIVRAAAEIGRGMK